MKIVLFACVLLFVIQGCTKLPKPGWYVENATGGKVYSLFVGKEKEITEKYPGRFSKQQFIAALNASPSSQYMTAGRTRYYVVLCDNPESMINMRIITLEILERDYK